MTEKEAIKHLQVYRQTVGHMIDYCKNFEPNEDISGYLDKKETFDIAINALEEIQQYREMEEKLHKAYGVHGNLLPMVVNQICAHDGVDIGSPVKSQLLTNEDVDKWEQYKSIGTVEECREAVEKQKAKKPIHQHNPYLSQILCPICGEVVGCVVEGMEHPEQIEYCTECGQHILKDWSEEE